MRLIFLLIACIGLLFGGTTGKLTGGVKDEKTGEPLIGCNVIVEETYLGAATDAVGEYVILNIPPGKYTVRFNMIGYAPLLVTDVPISVDKTRRLDMTLQMEVLDMEEITVVGGRELIQFDLTNTEARVTSEDLETLPVSEVSDVIKLQAGITQDPSGGIHLRGGRTGEIQYMVDGVSMTDVYDGQISVNIENDNISELQVISGTYNAEYGKAMSGIINMVTKDGGNKFSGSVSAYAGDHTTSDTLFKNLATYSPNNDINISGNLSGPILKDRLTFYSSGRYFNSDGWLDGLETFTLYGDTLFRDTDGDFAKGGGEDTVSPHYRSMNWSEKWSTQNKLMFRVTNKSRLRFNHVASSESYQTYDHFRQMTHQGRRTHFQSGNFMGVTLSHTISPVTFLNLYLSQYRKSYKGYLFADPLDSRYVTPDSLFWAHLQGEIPAHILSTYGEVNYFPFYSFDRWGVDTGRFQRETITDEVKLDLTSQINKYNQIKLGVDLIRHRLTLDTYSLLDASQTDRVFTPLVPEEGSFNRTQYDFEPQEMSVYVQDKIEYGDMIVNLGVRFDWFDPGAEVPRNIHEPYIKDPRNPALDSLSLEERENIEWGAYSGWKVGENGDSTALTFADYYAKFNDQPKLVNEKGWWRSTSKKSHLSPRLGVAYPISDRGVIHFAYGYFFQIPNFHRLYDNSEYKLTETGTDFGIFGNPDLKPERTVSYELGLQQGLSTNLRIEITGYHKDIRDWISSGIPIDLGDGKSYYTFVNKDYSNVRGVIISLDKGFSENYVWHLDYTYQVNEGSNSDPAEEFGAVLAGQEPSRSIIPMDWDQLHTLNVSAVVSIRDWGANLILQYGSGYPYTPIITNYEQRGGDIANTLLRNSRRKQTTVNVDVKAFRELNLLGDIRGRIFLNVYNLFDRRNERIVYGDTGRANRTIEQARAEQISRNEPLRPNSLSDFFARPDWYSPPRQIQFGVKLSW